MSADNLGEDGFQAPISNQESYSTAYSDIVGERDNLIDMIAYCIYKQQKREFVLKKNLIFSDPRVRNYHDDLNENRISSLKLDATMRLREYANTIEKNIEEIEIDKVRNGAVVNTLSELIKEKHGELSDAVKIGTVWWKAVIYSVVGGFTLGLVIVAASHMGFMNPFDALPSKPLTAPVIK